MTPEEVDAVVAGRLEGLCAQINTALAAQAKAIEDVCDQVNAGFKAHQAMTVGMADQVNAAFKALGGAPAARPPALGEITVRLEHGLPAASLKRVHRSPDGGIDYIEEVREA